jgi:hypothetical protein
MCSDRRDAKKELDAILERLLDSIRDAPPEEMAEEALASGQDLREIEDEVKSSLRAGLKRFEQRKLQAAKEAYKLRTEQQPKRYVLPPTAEGRRSQLFGIFNTRPEMKAMLTAQHRNFDNLTDQDVESALEQLAELGLFDDGELDKSE